MNNKKMYACHNSHGQKLGFIELNSNHEDLRLIFIENKSIIKKKYPATAFIKPVSPK